MQRTSYGEMECGIAQALERIGDWWTLLIVREAMFGHDRFEQFHQNLGIARNVLTARLRSLVDSGIMVRTPDEEDRRRVRYRLTAAGRDLWIVLVALQQWGNRWVYDGDAPTFVVARSSGKPVAKLQVKDARGNPVRLRDVTLAPGDAASPALLRRFAAAPRSES